jgi:hypothetical protein
MQMTQQIITVKRLGVVSVGMFFAVLGAIYGLLSGLVTGLGIIPGMSMGTIASVGAVALSAVAGAFVFAIVWFIGGCIAAVIYNLVFAASGGIEVEIDVHG